SDEGIYTCKASNQFGVAMAEANLTVFTQPTILTECMSRVTGVGRKVTFHCEFTANPQPNYYWIINDSHPILFPGTAHENVRVGNDGTLVIDPVRKEDAGHYSCRVTNEIGQSFMTAELVVKGWNFYNNPPPIITSLPFNQTLPVGEVAHIQCSASGHPVPLIRWLKNGRSLSPSSENRMKFMSSGSLTISDLTKSDSGTYMCQACSESGETTRSAYLSVESQTNHKVVFHTLPSHHHVFPNVPLTEPTIVEVYHDGVKLSWRFEALQGVTPVTSFSVEYFSHETGESWVVANDNITSKTYTVTGLKPDKTYVFFFRARNSHGFSGPSPLTAPVKTKCLSSSRFNKKKHKSFSKRFVKTRKLKTLQKQAASIAATDDESNEWVQSDSATTSNIISNSKNSNIHDIDDNIPSNTINSHVLTSLQKFTMYDVNVQPYYGEVAGVASHNVKARTLQDVPSAPPSNVLVELSDNNTVHISWDPPPRKHHNGILLGYKIFMSCSESKFNREIKVNTSMNGVYIHNIIRGMEYAIQLCAFTVVGDGARSDVHTVG
ncbi:hypothetical protein HELRODRAFT_65728, partial [Helobdella robusta]|uniref:Uncharacterized protein n=1 Tax=Helobdella robusta TaxID=6412 RepID=T1FYC0_HELRO